MRLFAHELDKGVIESVPLELHYDITYNIYGIQQ